LTGELAEGTVSQLLRQIYVGRRNGLLHLVKGQERQSLRFRRGHIVNATTNVVEERLGEMLVRRGMLSPADLARATEIVLREGKRLGLVLSELGLIDTNGLEDAIALHVHEMLAKVFAWDEGSYSFEEEDDAPGAELTLKLTTGELILEAVQAVKDPDVVRYSLGDRDRVLRLSTDPLLRFQKLTLAPADGYVLSRVDGVTTAHEIVRMIPLPAEVVERSLLALLSTGVIEYAEGARRPRQEGLARPPAGATAATAAAAPAPAAPTPAARPRAAAPPAPAPPAPAPPPPAPASASVAATGAAPPPGEAAAPGEADARRSEIKDAFEGLKTRNHYEVLGLPRAASETDVKDSYFRLAKRFHPDAHHGESLGDLRDELEAVFIRLGEAYEVLRDARRRADYEQRLGRPRAPGEPAGPGPVAPADSPPGRDLEGEARAAEEALRRAAKLYEAEKYWDAIQLLEPAIEALPPKLKTRARVLLARCNLKNPKWVRRAEDALLATTREDPKAVDAWALLGQVYADKGLASRAQSMFRKVLELKPDHEEALQFLGTAAPETPEAPEPAPGLLRKLFRKP
jgi:tetratricopeptide (TPR) repeat protein